MSSQEARYKHHGQAIEIGGELNLQFTDWYAAPHKLEAAGSIDEMLLRAREMGYRPGRFLLMPHNGDTGYFELRSGELQPARILSQEGEDGTLYALVVEQPHEVPERQPRRVPLSMELGDEGSRRCWP